MQERMDTTSSVQNRIKQIIRYWDTKLGDKYLIKLPKKKTEKDSKLDLIIKLAAKSIEEKKEDVEEIQEERKEENVEEDFSWINQQLFSDLMKIQKEKESEIKKERKHVKYIYYNSYSSKPGDIYSIQTDSTKYFFIPSNIAVRRVPQYALGISVLGRTWPGTGMIEVLEGLYGNDFEEVLMHEVLHNLYPGDSEYMIRQKTKQRVPFPTKWN
ncbi:MAG: hypothetical protein H8D38_05800 [DPANN group archaeon]|nr:hypothetical protein [DPANN group archaeon]